MEEITKYRAYDGTEFFSKKECIKYEDSCQRITLDCPFTTEWLSPDMQTFINNKVKKMIIDKQNCAELPKYMTDCRIERIVIDITSVEQEDYRTRYHFDVFCMLYDEDDVSHTVPTKLSFSYAFDSLVKEEDDN